jgi:hypothetical protein
MKVTVETITPPIAEGMLLHNDDNRKLRPGVAERYADDMAKGRWTDCPEPISFYEDGGVADGQHRLWGVIISGVAVKMVVLRGLSREAALNINTGLPRTLADNSRISGEPKLISHAMISVACAFEFGNRSSRLRASNSVRLELIREHYDHCAWAIKHGPHGALLRNAITMSALARAHAHGVPESKLARFSEVMSTGFMDGDPESAAVAMRNYLLQKGQASSTDPMWRDTFLRVQNAIAHFAAGKKLSIVRALIEEAYPLPKKRANGRGEHGIEAHQGRQDRQLHGTQVRRARQDHRGLPASQRLVADRA